MGLIIKEEPFSLASPQTSFGVRLSRIHRNECVTNEPQRTSAGRLLFLLLSKQKREGGRHISGQFILKAKKKNGINLKRIWYQLYTSSFVSCFKIFFKNGFVKTGRTLRRKHYYFNA